MGNSSGKPVVFTDEVNLNHFRLLRVVGKGAFGKVRIVERKDTNLQFALKYIRKDEVVRSDSVRNILRERRMMQHLNHPFICNLRYSFQDIEYMYLVLDLMTGGDLRFHISRKTFTEEAVRFWMAELGCALRYIHKQGIIHRDVKPDNILLDSEGHVHLADFNVASDFVPNKLLTSKSGTLAYLAPEVYIGKGYTSGADWWSLGVCFYECIYNKRPFDGSTQSSLSSKISEANVNYPITSPPVSNPCLHAISCALEADPEKRMGSAGWHTFIDNPFFRDIDFDALERKEIEPVFVPSGEKTNFDATYDLEELLLEEAPLEARARRQKPREALKEGASDKEIKEEELYRMIENLYEPFDYTSAAYDRYANAMNQMTPGGAPVPVTVVYGNDPDARAIPMNRNASNQRSGAASAPSSVDGSPPIPTMPLPHTTPPRSTPGNHRQPPNFSTPVSYNSNANQHPSQSQVQQQQQQPQMPRNPATQPAYLTKSRSRRPSQSTRSQPSSGNMAAGLPAGMHIVPADGDTWSDLAQKDTTLPADAKELLSAGREREKPNGMLGFLSRKKGRGHSPKPQERGILSGKEGGRVVVGN